MTAVLDDYIARLSRWGRWGPNDQLGALNLVGAEQVRAAAMLVRDGKVISLTPALRPGRAAARRAIPRR